ncbi:hypothetical protein EW145_g2829 [Phellinidium pouzarii]|uniref:Mus7/MMS22 family-domain-containing protein n=1 Tax=Phellinidium pouzarii TaxID=167371 RepID=A0A4S4L9A9_9AGAM|nr:hypothetical protein EW145_g2829 [Phellinidium pouzarii]
MDEEEYVEASDSEELEVLRAVRGVRFSTPATRSLSLRRTSAVAETPRKRRKVYHSVDSSALSEDAISNSEATDSRSDVADSSTPVALSIDLPTSTTISSKDDQPYTISQKIYEAQLGEVFESYPQEIQQGEPNEAIALEDIGLHTFELGSQDELDVISQFPNTTPHKIQKNGNVARSSSLGLFPLRAITSSRSLEGRESSLPSPLGRKLSVVPQLPERAQNSLAPLSSQGRNDRIDHSSPLSSPSPSPRLLRYSSLPPSSPIRSSSSISYTPQRALSLSPGRISRTPSQSQQEIIGHQSNNGDLLLQELSSPRRYSLRNRQPRQLNPYAYDKRLYKLQMRHNPDAIVKVVSPPRQHGEQDRAHKSHNPQEEDNFADPDDGDEESQELLPKRRSHRDSREAVPGVHDSDNGDVASKWLPKAFEMSDDDLPPLPSNELSKLKKPSAPVNVPEIHRAKSRKLHKFPLLEARARRDNSSARVEESSRDIIRRSHVNNANASGTRSVENGSSGPGWHSPANTRRPSRITPECPADDRGRVDTPVHDFNNSFDINTGQDFHDVLRNDIEMEYGLYNTANNNESSPQFSTSHVNSSRLLLPSSNEEDEEDENSGCEDQSPPSVKGAKSINLKSRDWKILNHMMPRVMLSKVLGTHTPIAKKAPRARSSSAVLSQHHSGSEVEHSALIPGRSRIRRRSSVQLEDHEILGDTESSGPEVEDVDNSVGDISDLDSVGDRSYSEASSTDSTFEGSDPEELQTLEVLDEESGYFDQDFSRLYQGDKSISRRREDLIDRMLSRTSRGKTSSKSKSGRRKHKLHSVGRAHPKNPTLDVAIPHAHYNSHSTTHGGSSLQTRLPFSAVAAAANKQSPDNIVDLTESYSPPSTTKKDNVIHLGVYEKPKGLSKKQRRDAALCKTLFTVPGHGKSVTSGRSKGFHRIQIDMADDGFREALAPLCPVDQKTLQSKRVFRRSESRLKSKPNGFEFEPKDDQPALRQTSLHDFAHHDGDGFDVSTFNGVLRPVPASARQNNVNEPERFASCSIDMDISPLPLGLAFGQSTYLGKQLLHELLVLVSDEEDIRPPMQYTGFGLIDMDPDMSPARFSETLEVTSNLIYEWLNDELPHSAGENDVKRYELLMYSVCQFAAWILSRADVEGKSNVQTSVSFCSRQLIEKSQSHLTQLRMRGKDLDLRVLAVLWFSVELTTRTLVLAIRSGFTTDNEDWRESVLSLVQTLLGYGIKQTLEPIQNASMNDNSTKLRTAELWICLIHLLPRISGLGTVTRSSSSDAYGLWSFILQIFQSDKLQAKSDVEVSEHLWRIIFSLSALSQFSAHGNSTANMRISASWEVVAFALDAIRLTHEVDKDKNRSYESLQKRDKYVRMVVARCYLLSTKWHWALYDAYVMFKKLVVVFKSRLFANLLGEDSDFPAFLRHTDLRLLDTISRSDSAFSLFLKLVVLAARPDENTQETAQRVQSRLTKLLSLTVPLSGVSFSETRPPLSEELSMLYNRYSAIIVAIYVDSSEANIRERLDRARRYINFAEADGRSRRACIRALMYIAILVQHLSLPLTEPLKWLGEITETLLAEFAMATTKLVSKGWDSRQAKRIVQKKNKSILAIQLLLGSVRKILETPHMKSDAVDTSLRYPDVGLLSGPWIKRVFSLKELTNIATTRYEILLLVRSFLDARSKVVSPPRRPTLPALDTTESQDLYDEFGFDDDVLAALDLGDGVSAIDVNKEKDEVVAEIMNTDIVPAILRLVLQYFNDPTASLTNEERLAEYWNNADEWVDCWVGCAAIVVRNGKRDHENAFFGVLLESLVSLKVTMENEYVSLLCSIDGLRHTMLRALPLHRDSDAVDFQLSRAQFVEIRIEILEGIISNLNSSLQRASIGNLKDLTFINQSFLECLVLMLSTMQDIWKALCPPKKTVMSTATSADKCSQ